ncbi:hypothetical protein CSC36_2112 [Pseudomonas aeruginosa]|nr:hypothetical protein CSC36_2112 [Pseudomonas aeruginosa]
MRCTRRRSRGRRRGRRKAGHRPVRRRPAATARGMPGAAGRRRQGLGGSCRR